MQTVRDETANVKKKPSRTKTRKIVYTVAGVLILLAIIAAIVLTSYPSAVIKYAIEPKLKQLVQDRLGRRYSLEMTSITLSPNKDSLILTGVRIVDNGKTGDGSSDTSQENFGVATPLDRLTTDTITIAALDYWKLVFQKGLFAGTITIRSPKIYLRPGTLPKFAENSDLLPSFLPAVSSKVIRIENAEVYLSEGNPKQSSGLFVKKASLAFEDFYLDEPTYKKAASTFFCKSATFVAEDISHIDSLGITDIRVVKVDGNLTDSSMNVYSIESTKPIEEVRKVKINHIQFSGLDWSTALAGHGLHGRIVAVTTPQIFLQDIANIRKDPSFHYAASDLIPLPSLLPDVSVEHVEVTGAEVYALLPESHETSSLKRITLSLNKFKIDKTTPFTNVTTFFSRSATYGNRGNNILNTSLGVVHLGEIKGTDKLVAISDISMNPTLKGIELVKLRSVEIGGLNIWKLLMREGIFSASLHVKQPDIFLDGSVAPPITSIDSVFKSDPLALIRDREYPLPFLLPVANIGSVTVSDGSVHGIHFLEDPKNKLGAGDSLTQLNISLSHFKLDKNSWLSNRGMLFSDAGTFSVGKLTQLTRGALYTYKEAGIKGDLRKHTLTIDSLIVHPLLPEDSFGLAFKYRNERIDFFAPKVSVAGVDYQKMFLGNGIFADSINIEHWRMLLYGDRRKPEEIRSQRERFPSEFLQEIRTPIGIKAMNIREGNIAFRERWPDTTRPGTITLNHVNATVGAISNDTSLGDTMITNIIGDLKVMNAGLVNFTIGYQLMNPRLTFGIRGKVGSMDASLLNEYLALTEPFTLTGNVRSADININVKDSLMTGTLTPQYDSLRVTFFRWDNFPPGFVSLIANAIFMRSHNVPELDHPLHSGDLSAILDRNGSLFWGLWLPIRESIGSIVRIPEWVW